MKWIPLLLLVACTTPKTDLPKKENPYLVYFVGNNLTANHNIPAKFLQTAKNQKLVPDSARIQKTLKGGARLSSLFNEFAVKQLLNSARFIVLQEQSLGLYKNSTFGIIDMYRNIANLSGAQAILYATWETISFVRDLRACTLDTYKDEFRDFATKHELLPAPVSSVWVAACRKNIQSDLIPLLGRSWVDYHTNLAGAYAAAQTFLIFPQKTVFSAPPTFGLPNSDV